MPSLFLFCSILLQALTYDFSDLDVLICEAIQKKIFPGAVVLINHQGKTTYHKAFGRYTYDTRSPRITTDTLFDIASLTKVVATTTIAMQLYDAQQLKIDVPVFHYLPYFNTSKKKPIHIHHLLTHTSGIKDKPIKKYPISPATLWKEMTDNEPLYEPNETYNYTCSNMIFMQKIIEKITGLPFETCFNRYVTKPLNLKNTKFKPTHPEQCAPNESHHRGIVQGSVHDDRAFILGEVTGNAGLFSTARDLETWMLMIMRDGTYTKNNKQYQLIKPETIRSWTTCQCDFNRGYGWEIGRHLSEDAFGHFGWTGVSIWADKKSDYFVIILTNRTYAAGDKDAMTQFRIDFHNAVTGIIDIKGS